MKIVNGKKIRSVDQYLAILKAAGRSDITLRNYRYILGQYAKFIGVKPEELHNNLNSEDLVRYAAAISSKRAAGRKSTLITIHRYMTLNGVVFDELEKNVAMVNVTQEREDKPLTVELLQKMMDQGSPHTRALISFLVSTGCRAGETAKLLLSDVGRIEHGAFVPDINGSVVQIRNDIAKRKKGGLVFLTAEAREYLTVWLKDRDRYIADANRRTAQLFTATTRHDKVPRKDTGTRIERPANDKRLFACSYGTIDKVFVRLYMGVDGGRGDTTNRAKVTAHACRAFFRTNAAKTMGVDLAEGILRHTGYLNAAYVRMTPQDRERQFHDGEAALYITRADHRIQTGKLSALEEQNKELRERLQAIEKEQIQLTDDLIAKTKVIEQNPRHEPDIDKIMARMRELEEKLDKLTTGGN